MTFRAYTTQTSSDLYTELRSRTRGLTAREVADRLRTNGPNLVASTRESVWRLVLRQIVSPFILLLIGATIVSLLLGQPIEGGMILLFVLINASLGFCQEYHSRTILSLLTKYIDGQARVRRDGHEHTVPHHELVPGDIVIVTTGDLIPAEIRFLEEEDLTVDESVLTGESAPVKKYATPLDAQTNEIYAAANIGFSGTAVVSGKGIGIVFGTGAKTAIGEITDLTQNTGRVGTFEKGINAFSRFVVKLVSITLLIVFLAHLVLKNGQLRVWELLLFSIALAVSVIPEALPLVMTISLSKGALRLAKNNVVVKRLSSIEDLGSIQVLCTDKTGTITKNMLTVTDVWGKERNEILCAATLASSCMGDTHRQTNNAFDIALWQALSRNHKKTCEQVKRLDEFPFDPVQRKNGVLVERNGFHELIARGAVEHILSSCSEMEETERLSLRSWTSTEEHNGKRVIAVAIRSLGKTHSIKADDLSRGMTLVGAIAFEDPIKPTSVSAVAHAKKLGVNVKMLTGDGPEVAKAVAISVGLCDENDSAVLTGDQWDAAPAEDRGKISNKYAVFARMSPQQKHEVIKELERSYEVGFLGEGINDAPALKTANVGLAVSEASDIAREAADIILLDQSLETIVNGIREGRKMFANTTKYIKATLASNFGNFYAVAIASLLIDVLPLLPLQILLLNLLSDFPMIAIATDNVDTEELRRPKTYQIKEIILAATILGLVSTLFDFIFFALFRKMSPSTLYTNWFIGSVLTELLFVFSIRTKRPFWKARRPSALLLTLTIAAAICTITLPYTYLGMSVFHFARPITRHLTYVFALTLIYFITTETVKLFYTRFAQKTSASQSATAPQHH